MITEWFGSTDRELEAIVLATLIASFLHDLDKGYDTARTVNNLREAESQFAQRRKGYKGYVKTREGK